MSLDTALRPPAALAGLDVDDPASEVLSIRGLAALIGQPVSVVDEWRWRCPEKVPPAFQPKPLRWLRSTVTSWMDSRVDDPSSEVLSIRALAKLLGVSERTIENNRWRAPHKVPPPFQSKPLRWRRSSVEAWMSSNEARRERERSRARSSVSSIRDHQVASGGGK